MNLNEVKKRLIQSEGMEFVPYRDSKGILTIACGWNMEAHPLPKRFQEKLDSGDSLSVEDCMELLDMRLRGVVQEITKFNWFGGLSYARKTVVCDMVYNLGLGSFLGFKKLIKAIEAEDYTRAAIEMLESKWEQDVGERAHALAKIMETDEL